MADRRGEDSRFMAKVEQIVLRAGRTTLRWKRSCLPLTPLIAPVSDAGGVTEISRWRKPPDPIPIEIRPGGGGGNAPVSRALAGAHRDLLRILWLAPPAHFRSPPVCRRVRHSRENQSLICATRYSAIAFATAGKVTRRFLSNVLSTSARSMNSTSRKHFGTRSSFLCWAS